MLVLRGCTRWLCRGVHCVHGASIRPKNEFRIILISFVYWLMPMFISDNSECFTVRRGQPRARSVPRQDAADDDGRAGGHLSLNLCTHSTRHSVDTSACIRTTSWLQQSGVYRRQTACRLIVVSGELVALSSLAQHRCRHRHAIAFPSR